MRARSASARMALSATSNAPRRSFRSSRTSRPSRDSLARGGPAQRGDRAERAPADERPPVSVTLRVPPPALRGIGARAARR